MKTVIGLFDTRDKAQHAMAHLQTLGIGPDHMELKPGKELFTERQRSSAEEHGGGMLNRLREFLGLDTSETEAQSRYDLARIDPNDAVLVCDTSDDMADKAAEIMNRDGAVDIDQRWGSHVSTAQSSQSSQSSGMASSALHSRPMPSADTQARTASTHASATTGMPTRPASTAEGGTLSEVEEDLAISKRPVTRGKVRIYTVPTQHTVEKTVNLKSEHVQLQREHVDRPLRGDEVRAFENQTIEVTETSEEPVVSKRARVKEEVHVRKAVEEHPQTIRETVRGTEVKVERENDRSPKKR